MDTSLNKLWEIVQDREAWCTTVHEVGKSQRQLSKSTTTKINHHYLGPALYPAQCTDPKRDAYKTIQDLIAFRVKLTFELAVKNLKIVIITVFNVHQKLRERVELGRSK